METSKNSFFIETPHKFEIDYLSPSSLDSFARCPAKFCYSKLMRLEKQGMYKTPLLFGQCIHAAIYAAYTDPHEAFEIFNDMWTSCGGTELEDDSRNPQQALGMFINFYQFHSAKLYTPLTPPGGITITKERYNDYEAPVLIDIGGAFPLYGKIDRLVEWSGKTWPLDYKTASMITARTCENMNICTQTLAYTLMASVLYGNMLNGILFEFLRVTKTKNNFETYLHPVYVKEHWLKTFVKWYIYQSNQIKRMCTECKFPKNPSACSAYGQHGVHGYPCEFSDLCNAECYEDMIKYYDKNDFNPLKDVEKVQILELKK